MVLIDAVRVGHCQRRVVDGINGDRDGHLRRGPQAVVGAVFEAVGAVEVGIGRVGERAVVVERQTAVLWTTNQNGRQIGTLRVAIVVENSRSCVDHQRHVLINLVLVGNRNGQAVDNNRHGDFLRR